MLVEIETMEGERLPEDLMRDPNVEVVVIKRLDSGAVIECVRVSETPSVSLYLDPNTFMTEPRLCHTWQVTMTRESRVTTQTLVFPVNNKYYYPENDC